MNVKSLTKNLHEISAHLIICTKIDQTTNSSSYEEAQKISSEENKLPRLSKNYNTCDDQENLSQVSFLETNNTSGDVSNDLKWSSEQTLLLIRIIESHYVEFDSQLKKNVWQKISRELSEITNKNFSSTQCDNKWQGLKKMYKHVKDHNNTSGNNTKTWQFYEPIHSFLGG